MEVDILCWETMQEVWFRLLKHDVVQSCLEKKLTGSWNSCRYSQRATKAEGRATKLVPKLLGNDTLYSQVRTLIFEAVPVDGLVLNSVVQ